MPKALEGAALLAGAVTIGALSLGVGAAAAFANTTWMLGLMESAAVGGVAMEAGAIADYLTTNRGINITTRATAAPRQIIYGQQRVGGIEIYRSTTGSHHDQFNYVIVLAGHPCDSIVNLYLDGRQVYWNVGSIGNVTTNGVNFGGTCDSSNHIGPNGVTYNFGGGVYCEAKFGNQVSGDVIGGLTANDPNWAAGPNGNPYVGGCTYVYLKIEYNTNNFPGEPQIRFTVNGKNNIFDPRTSSTGFTTNWALITADVITDTTFGLGDDSVNQLQLIAAANVCDELVEVGAVGVGSEARYTTHYHYDTTQSPGNALAAMMDGAAGRLSRIGGEWYIWPAYWQGPSFTYDENSLIGPMMWEPYKSFRDLINRVTGTYIAPNYPYNTAGNLYDSNGYYNGMIQNNFPFAFQPTNFPMYASDVLHGYASDEWLNEDGGILLPKDIGLTTVLSVTQAQRVAKIMLLRNRQQGVGTFTMGLDAFRMQPCDVMQFTFAQNGWTEKSLEVFGFSFQISDSGDGGVQSVKAVLQVQETDESVYAWSTEEELTVYDVPAIPTQTNYSPNPPTNMTLTSGVSTALVTLDGVVHPRIEVQWDTPLDVLTKQIQIQYSTVADPTVWIDIPLVDVSQNLTFIADVVAGNAYNVRIRGVRPNGAQSPWEEIDGYVVSKTLSVVGIISISQESLIGEAYSDGTAGIEVLPFTASVGNAAVSVLPGGPYTITGLVQGTLYFVYYIDPAFAGGAIVPIATQTTSDFVNKPGYFLIGSIITPNGNGSGGGGSGSGIYRPTSYIQQGSRTSTTPEAAYDGSQDTFASVTGTSTTYSGGDSSDPTWTIGGVFYQGWPMITVGTGATLNIIAEIDAEGCQCSALPSVGATWPSYGDLPVTVVNAAKQTYSAPIPSGTNIGTLGFVVSVNGQFISGSSDEGDGSGTPISTVTGTMKVYDIWISV